MFCVRHFRSTLFRLARHAAVDQVAVRCQFQSINFNFRLSALAVGRPVQGDFVCFTPALQCKHYHVSWGVNYTQGETAAALWSCNYMPPLGGGGVNLKQQKGGVETCGNTLNTQELKEWNKREERGWFVDLTRWLKFTNSYSLHPCTTKPWCA